jgi:hypothetical protein
VEETPDACLAEAKNKTFTFIVVTASVAADDDDIS